MKKLVLLLAVVFSASLFSCGGEKKAETTADTTTVDTTVTEQVDTTSVPVDTVKTDSVAVDTTKAAK